MPAQLAPVESVQWLAQHASSQRSFCAAFCRWPTSTFLMVRGHDGNADGQRRLKVTGVAAGAPVDQRPAAFVAGADSPTGTEPESCRAARLSSDWSGGSWPDVNWVHPH